MRQPDDKTRLRGPSPIRDPRAEYERRRAERLAAQAERGEMAYGSYLRWLTREDQVFGVLLGLLGLQIAVSLIGVALSSREDPLWSVALVSPLFQLIMLLGILSFQRWAHTIVIWLAALNLLFSAVGVVSLVMAPFATNSALHVLGLWFRWLFGLASTLFVLVVLSERTAYFEGASSRVQPKVTRLRDFLKRDYWRHALERVEERPSLDTDMPPQPRQRMRSSPSQVEGGSTDQTWGRQEDESIPRVGMETVPQEPRPEMSDFRGEARGTEATAPTPPARPRPGGWAAGRDDSDSTPLEPARGQAGGDLEAMRQALTLTRIKALAREDRLFAALLLALAMHVVVVITGNLWAFFGAVALTWAVLALRPWAFWLALFLSIMQVLLHAALLTAAIHTGKTPLVGVTYVVAILLLNGFIAAALIARRDYFL